MAAGKNKKVDNPYPLDPPIPPDPEPSLPIERGPKDEGVGMWVPEEKHRLLWETFSPAAAAGYSGREQ